MPRTLDPSVMLEHCWTSVRRHSQRCECCRGRLSGLLCAICEIVHDNEHPNGCQRCGASLWLVPSVKPCPVGDYHLLRLCREIRKEAGQQLRLDSVRRRLGAL